MSNKVKNVTLEQIQAQLEQVAKRMPELKDKDHPAGEIWDGIVSDLDQIAKDVKHQALVLRTASNISEATESIPELEDLVQRLVKLIQERFNFSSVSLYLQENEQAKLYASEGKTPPPQVTIDEETKIGQAILSKKPILLVNDEVWSTPNGSFSVNEPLEMVLPLISLGEATGVLIVESQQQAVFSPDSVTTMQILANQVASTIQNTSLFTTIEQQLEQLATLYNIGLQIGSYVNISLQMGQHYHNLDTLLNDVAQLSVQLITGDASIIRLVDRENEALINVRATYNLPERIVLNSPEDITDEASLSGQVIQSRQAILANDWSDHPLAESSPDDEAGMEEIQAIIIVPINLQDKIIGTIEVQSFSKAQAFEENDLRILSLLASQAAIAIKNIRLYYQAEKNRRFLKTVIEHIPDPIFIKDRNHKLIEMNQASMEVVGDAALEKTNEEIFPSQLAEQWQQRDLKVFETNDILTFEDSSTWADGAEHTSYTRLIPIPDSQGQAKYILGITHDITEHKQIEETLRFQKTLLEAQGEASPDGMLAVSNERELLSYNHRFIEMWDIPEEQMETGSSEAILEVMQKRVTDAEAFMAQTEYLYQHRDEKSQEKITLKDGRILDRYSAPLESPEGIHYGRVWYFRDITEQELAESAIRESEEKYRTILENIEDGYYEFDLSGVLTFVNPALSRIFEYPMDELPGMSYKQFTDEATGEKAFQAFNQVFQTGEPTRGFEWQIITQDDQRKFIETSITLAKDSEGEPIGFLGFARDITERKETEQEILRRNEELAALNRITTIVTSTLDLEDMLQATAKELTQIFEAGRSGITLLNSARTELTIIAEHTTREGDFKAKGTKIPVADDPLTEQIINQGQSLVVPEAQTNELTQSVHDLLRQMDTNCLMIIPLLVRGQVIGVIGVELYQSERLFTENEIKLAETIASQVANSVENARLFEQTQAALAERKQTEEKYRSIFENTLEGIFQTTPEGEYISANPALARIYGYSSPEELIESLKDIEHNLYLEPDRRAEFIQLMEENETISDFESQVQRKDDSVIWISEAARNVRDEEGNLLYYEGTVSDITQRKEAEESLAKHATELEEARNFLDSIIENIPSMLFVKDAEELRFIRFNKAGEDLIGVKREDMLGKNDRDFFPAEVADFFMDKDRGILESGEMVEVKEEPIETIHKGTRILHTRKVPMTDREGNPKYLMGISEDVTERKKSEEALRNSEALYSSLVESLPQNIFRKDLNGRITFVNQRYCDSMGLTKEELIGKSDFDLYDTEVAKKYIQDDQQVIEQEEVFETTEEHSQENGQTTYIQVVKTPTYNSEGKVIGIQGMSWDVTERRRSEKALQEALARTQTLHRISNTLSTATTQQNTFEAILGEYLSLLNLKRGGVMLFDDMSKYHQVQALYIKGQAVKPNLKFPVSQDLIAREIIREREPVVIKDVANHPLTQDTQNIRGEVASMLLIPLIMRDKVVGIIGADAIEQEHTFSQDDIEMGTVIADQLTIWLENWRLLEEAQHRSDLLKTAAEVSRAASSILEMDQLIKESVNFIRDKFDFYYVGLFIVDEARKWAVLRAGTGEAGRIQIENNHRLEIGGQSMIGWSIQNRKARIALDVGEDAVQFYNIHLPDTHSEMALPLISRDEVIGALTVQSVERGAFSDEDVTLLQTMADQLANAISNARLFENVAQAQMEAEDHLQETIALQQLSQALSSTLKLGEILDLFFRACTNVLGFEYIVFALVDRYQNHIKAIAGQGVAESYIKQAIYALDDEDNIMVDVLHTGETEIITGWDDRLDKEAYERENQKDWKRVFAPITLQQENIGIVEIGFNQTPDASIPESQLRLLRTFIDQTALAVDNAQRYEVSQRIARREALIKEITTKVRASTNLDTILQTTVAEVGNALKGKRTYVHLVTSKKPRDSKLSKD